MPQQSYSCGFCSALQTCLSLAAVHLLPTPPQQRLTPNPAPPLPFWVPLSSPLSEPCFCYSSFSAHSQLWAKTRHLWFSTSTTPRSNNTGIISGLVFSVTSPAAGTGTLVCHTEQRFREYRGFLITQRTGITQSCLCRSSLPPALLRTPLLPIYTFTQDAKYANVFVHVKCRILGVFFSLLAFSSNFQGMVLLEETRSKLKRSTALCVPTRPAGSPAGQ